MAIREVITPHTNLGEIAAKYPEAAEYLLREWELHCVGCPANLFDTLADGMRLHGFHDEDIRRAVSELNVLIGATPRDERNRGA